MDAAREVLQVKNDDSLSKSKGKRKQLYWPSLACRKLANKADSDSEKEKKMCFDKF